MFTAEVRVRYAETDAMGVVHHSNYLVWFELGRVELMRHLKVPYTQFEEMGLAAPVIEASIRWLAPARFDDLLRIEPRVEELSRTRVRFAYRIHRPADDKLLCEGHTLHAFLGPEGRPVNLAKRAPSLYEALQPSMPVDGTR